MPTLGEFLKVAGLKGVVIGVSSAVIGPDGEERFRYAQKSPTSPPVILPGDDDDRLTPTVLSNYCRQLDIDESEFGLSLGLLSGEFRDTSH